MRVLNIGYAKRIRGMVCRSRVIPKHLLLFTCFPHSHSYDTGNSNDSFHSDRFYEFSSVGHPVERVATLMYMRVWTCWRINIVQNGYQKWYPWQDGIEDGK